MTPRANARNVENDPVLRFWSSGEPHSYHQIGACAKPRLAERVRSVSVRGRTVARAYARKIARDVLPKRRSPLQGEPATAIVWVSVDGARVVVT